MLSARLAALAARIRPGSRLADVGTDHAYLPIFAVQQNTCPFAIATDIRSGPVTCARKHVATVGLADRIDVRKGDGLSTVKSGEVDDIVIAGMGGELIASILEAVPLVRDPHVRLLLQPMSRPEKLREYLLTNGFSLEWEDTVCDGEHLYIVMQASFTNAAPITDVTAYYIGALSSENTRYGKQLCDRLEQKALGLASGGATAGAKEVNALLEKLRAYWQEGE